MKRLISITVMVLLVTNICIAQTETIEFVPRGPQGNAAILKLTPSNETVWTEDGNSNTSALLWKIPDFEPYSNAQLVASKKSGNELCAVFEFSCDKSNPRVKRMFEQMHHLGIPNEFEQWNGKMLFFRQFHRDAQGVWHPRVSVFPTTIWRSTVNATVKAIEITSAIEFAIVFQQEWRMEQGATNAYSTKVVIDVNGETRMRLKFQEDANLVLVAGTEGVFRYVPESDWWVDFDEWNVDPLKQINERGQWRKERAAEAQTTGVIAQNNSQY